MGILANSASKTHTSSSADDSASGYLTSEQVTLSVSPTGTTYEWGLSIPSGSVALRSGLTDTDIASPRFSPDVAGYYTLTCIVDGSTLYVLRISVTQAAASTSLEALRLQPKVPAAVTAPSSGSALFHNDTVGLLAVKSSTGTVRTVLARAVTPTGTADATGSAGDIAYDDSFVYVKTSAGWKRAALSSF